MASNTENVKLGVCSITYDGFDLGYTKGGVDVVVSTDTYPVTVDQFGESTINEYVTKRNVKISCPLAETTLENLARIMPGATLVSDGMAIGSITYAGQPSANDTIVMNGVTFTWKAVAAAATDIAIGATLADSLRNAADKLNTSPNPLVSVAFYSANATVLAIKYDVSGTEGNAFTLAKVGTAGTVSGATLTGGGISTKMRVDVTNAVGTNLLKTARQLVLHPIELDALDTSEDFIVPLASTAGAMKFAYKHNEERIFNTEFTGYPDPATKILFRLGDLTAV